MKTSLSNEGYRQSPAPNAMRKFTDSQLEDLHAAGWSDIEMARMLHVRATTVYHRRVALGLASNSPHRTMVSPKHARCAHCGLVKHVRDFPPGGCVCANCVYVKQVTAANADIRRALQMRNTWKRCTAKRLGFAYELTVDDLWAMWLQQQGLCDNCGCHLETTLGAGRSPQSLSIFRHDTADDFTAENCSLACLDCARNQGNLN